MTFIFSSFPSLWVSVLCVRDSGDDGTSGLGICGFFTLSCDTSSVPNKMDLCTSHKVTLMSRWNSTFEGILTSVSTMKAFVLWFFFIFLRWIMITSHFPQCRGLYMREHINASYLLLYFHISWYKKIWFQGVRVHFWCFSLWRNFKLLLEMFLRLLLFKISWRHIF